LSAPLLSSGHGGQLSSSPLSTLPEALLFASKLKSLGMNIDSNLRCCLSEIAAGAPLNSALQ